MKIKILDLGFNIWFYTKYIKRREKHMDREPLGSLFVFLGMILVIWSFNRINRNKKNIE